MKKTLNKRIFALILTIFISIIAFLPLFSKKTNVLADTEQPTFSNFTADNFSSSNIFVPVLFSNNTVKLLSFSFSSSYLDGEEINVSFTCTFATEIISSFNYQLTFYSSENLPIGTQQQSGPTLSFNPNSYFKTHINIIGSIEGSIFDIGLDFKRFKTTNYFYGVRTYSDRITSQNDYNIISFLLDNGSSLDFNFQNLDNSNLYFNDTTYLFQNSNIGYQQGFDEGYSNGFADGEDYANLTAKDKYYQQGYDLGFNEGKNEGFNLGVESANDYSFLGLIGAVVDVPVQTLAGLLNFDILGFNMFNLFKGLITLTIILFVVKLII